MRPADEGEGDEDESEEQPGVARADQAADGERRPRRRGRRGGRRRRGGPEDGLVGSIADELGPTSAPEVTSAVADFDGYSPAPAPTDIQPEPSPPRRNSGNPITLNRNRNRCERPANPNPLRRAEGAAARRRSTVREKVSFLSSAPAETPAPVTPSQPEAPASTPAQTASETETDTQPRKAGWWSRRFGSGE